MHCVSVCLWLLCTVLVCVCGYYALCLCVSVAITYCVSVCLWILCSVFVCMSVDTMCHVYACKYITVAC